MSGSTISALWVYLAASPLLGLTLTLLAYQGGVWLFRRSGQQAWANPVPLAILFIGTLLWLTGSLWARDGAFVIIVLPLLAILLPLSFALSHDLDLLAKPLQFLDLVLLQRAQPSGIRFQFYKNRLYWCLQLIL